MHFFPFFLFYFYVFFLFVLFCFKKCKKIITIKTKTNINKNTIPQNGCLSDRDKLIAIVSRFTTVPRNALGINNQNWISVPCWREQLLNHMLYKYSSSTALSSLSELSSRYLFLQDSCLILTVVQLTLNIVLMSLHKEL